MHMKMRHLPTMSKLEMIPLHISSTVRKTHNVGDGFAPNSREQLLLHQKATLLLRYNKFFKEAQHYCSLHNKSFIHWYILQPSKHQPESVPTHKLLIVT